VNVVELGFVCLCLCVWVSVGEGAMEPIINYIIIIVCAHTQRETHTHFLETFR
jgi:hypothetical protein